MAQAMLFHEVVDAVDQLSEEEQETLVDIVRRRLAEAGRRRIIAEVQQADREFAEGKCREMTVDEIMREITS